MTHAMSRVYLFLMVVIGAGVTDAAPPEPAPQGASKPPPTAIEIPVVKPDEVLSKSQFEVSVSLGGNSLGKVGTATETEFRAGTQLHQLSELEITVDRGNFQLQVRNQTGFVENGDGRLLRFHSVSRTTGTVQQTKTILGEIAAPTPPATEPIIHLRVSNGSRTLQQKLDWPKDALSPPQAQRRLLDGGLAVGKTVELLVYPIPDDPESAKPHTYRVVAEENLPFGTGKVKVFRVEITSELLGQEIRQLQWLDPKGVLYRHEVTLGAMTVTMVRK